MNEGLLDNGMVSVVIPCRNEKDYIGKCLDSIIHSDFPKDNLQVMVCDGQSDDGTVEIIKGYSQRFPFIHYVENSKRLTPFAMNLGIHHLPCDYVLIMGAHSEIDKDYISVCKSILDSDASIACVGGVLRNIYETEESSVIGIAMSSPFGVGNSHFRTGMKEGFVDTVGTPLYRYSTLADIGFFNQDLARNQDDELNFRVLKTGKKIYLTKKSGFDYYVRASFSKLFKQYFQYGYWKVYVNKLHSTVTTVRQLVPFLFVSSLMLSLLVALVFPPFIIVFAFIVLSYLAAAALFSMKEPGNHSKFDLLKAFFILHFSYGLGYLKGIFEFIILNKKPSDSQKQITR